MFLHFRSSPLSIYTDVVGPTNKTKWKARIMNLDINGATKLTNYVIGSSQEAKTFDNIDMTDGELIVKAVKASGSKPMISWIKVEQ